MFNLREFLLELELELDLDLLEMGLKIAFVLENFASRVCWCNRRTVCFSLNLLIDWLLFTFEIKLFETCSWLPLPRFEREGTSLLCFRIVFFTAFSRPSELDITDSERSILCVS